MKDVDAALLQEADLPPTDLRDRVQLDKSPPWHTAGAEMSRPWRAAVVGLSDRVDLEPIEAKTIEMAKPGELAISREGTLAVAKINVPSDPEPFTIVSMYGAWEKPISSAESSWIYADASVHRVISDLSIFIGRQKGSRIIAAGDLNILLGYGESGSLYWKNRYATVFERMAALGLVFAGPTLPEGGTPPLERPDELPSDSSTVPTFRTRRSIPESATRQLDFVFVSADLAESTKVIALNSPDEWGPSDHARLVIEVG